MRVETPNSFRECPSVTFTCLYLLTFANTSQSRETESASPNPSPGRNFDSPTLPSPLRLRNYHGGSFINYTHIHTTLKTVTATKNRQGYVLVARPHIKWRQTVLCLSIAGLYRKYRVILNQSHYFIYRPCIYTKYILHI